MSGNWDWVWGGRREASEIGIGKGGVGNWDRDWGGREETKWDWREL